MVGLAMDSIQTMSAPSVAAITAAVSAASTVRTVRRPLASARANRFVTP